MTDTATTEILSDAVPSKPVENGGVPMPAPATAPATGLGAERPEGLPEKFWDAARGQPRVDALANSYLQLEQKLGAMAADGVPEDPAGYEIAAGDGIPEADPEVNARLHAARFSQAQAQLVYELAGEYLAPVVGEMAAEFAAQGEQEELARHFGGPERWRETAGQIRDWGKANLADEVYQALAGTVDGVKAMHRMMGEGEPAMVRDGQAYGAAESEESLRALMRDPKYWRDHDPAIVQRVQQGFQRLYPDEA